MWPLITRNGSKYSDIFASIIQLKPCCSYFILFFVCRSVEDIPIYNYVSSVENPLSWGEFTQLVIKNGFDYPFSNAIYYLSFHMNRTAFMNRIYMLFLHILPALLIDFIAKRIRGKSLELRRTYEKIHKFSTVISYFCTNDWVIHQHFGLITIEILLAGC